MKTWPIIKIIKNITARHPFSTYVVLWFGLLMMTGLTVTAAGLNLGRWGIVGIILVAVIQCALIFLYFMHTKKEYLFFKFMLSVAIFILVAIMFFATSK